jgi:hypothetical protein
MKPTPRQKLLIEEIQNQAHFWMNTNDIDSPTHYCDIEEEVAKLEDDANLTKDERKKFEDLLGDLFDFIKKRK